MNNPTLLLRRLALLVGGTLALGACNRAQYAVLPRTDAYLGQAAPVAKARPATPAAEVAAIPAPATEASTPAPAANVAAAPKTVAPQAPAAPAAAATPAAEAPATVADAAQPRKLNLVQRLVLKKITKKLDKLAAQAPQLKQGDNTAGTARVDGQLRYAIIFGGIGVILILLANSGIIYTLGIISLIIGLIFLLLWLLNNL